MTMTTGMFQTPTPASPKANPGSEFDSGKNDVAENVSASTVMPGQPGGAAGAGAFDAGKNIVANPSATQITPGMASSNKPGCFDAGKNII